MPLQSFIHKMAPAQPCWLARGHSHFRGGHLMSRLESKAKLLYYPTPPCIVDTIVRSLTIARRYGVVRLLDPCAGTGEALARLTEHLRDQLPTSHAVTLTTYGIEPEITRAKAASSLLDAVLQ